MNDELERADMIERLPIVSEGMHRMIEEGMMYDDWKEKLHGLVSTLIRYVAEKEGVSFPNAEVSHGDRERCRNSDIGHKSP